MSPQEVKQIFAEAGAIISDGHFVYAKKPDGWYHGSDYINKKAIYLYPHLVRNLCRKIAHHFANQSIEVVVGPPIGGAILSQWTAFFLNILKSCSGEDSFILSVFTQEESAFERVEISLPAKEGLQKKFRARGEVKIDVRSGDLCFSGTSIGITFFTESTRFVIGAGYREYVKGKKCLIVEDIINSGATVAKMRNAVVEAGGKVIAIAALCNCSGGEVTASTLCLPELFSLLDLDMKMFPEDKCPICLEKGPKSVRSDLGEGKEFLARLAAASSKPAAK